MNDYWKIAYEAFCGAYQKNLPLYRPYETLIQELKHGWEAAAFAVLEASRNNTDINETLNNHTGYAFVPWRRSGARE